jgi:lysophospholipase L1-like esterase
VDDRPKWVVYGSSITFCKRTDSPSLSWPCIVARHLGLHLTNLGFGGQCHLDPMIIRLMRDLPADLVTVEAGINIYGQSSLGERTFLPALLGAIATIREGHPTCPFFVASPIYSPARETTPNAVGLTLQAIRAYTAKAVRIFRQRGDLHLHYVDGLDLFGPDMERHLVDGLHPGPEGNLRLADNVERALRIEEW